MADDERIPRFSYDLITMLNESVASPRFPNSAAGFAGMSNEAVRSAAFTAGARSVVDWLMDWRTEEDERGEQDDGDPSGVPDGPQMRFPRVFGSDGEVREISSPVTLAEDPS